MVYILFDSVLNSYLLYMKIQQQYIQIRMIVFFPTTNNNISL
jgi:hypothetical protein